MSTRSSASSDGSPRGWTGDGYPDRPRREHGGRGRGGGQRRGQHRRRQAQPRCPDCGGVAGAGAAAGGRDARPGARGPTPATPRGRWVRRRRVHAERPAAVQHGSRTSGLWPVATAPGPPRPGRPLPALVDTCPWFRHLVRGLPSRRRPASVTPSGPSGPWTWLPGYASSAHRPASASWPPPPECRNATSDGCSPTSPTGRRPRRQRRSTDKTTWEGTHDLRMVRLSDLCGNGQPGIAGAERITEGRQRASVQRVVRCAAAGPAERGSGRLAALADAPAPDAVDQFEKAGHTVPERLWLSRIAFGHPVGLGEQEHRAVAPVHGHLACPPGVGFGPGEQRSEQRGDSGAALGPLTGFGADIGDVGVRDEAFESGVDVTRREGRPEPVNRRCKVTDHVDGTAVGRGSRIPGRYRKARVTTAPSRPAPIRVTRGPNAPATGATSA